MLWSCKPIRSVSSDGGSTEGCSSVFCAWFIFQFPLRPRQLCEAKKTRPNLGKGNVLLCWCTGGFPVRDKSDLVPAFHSSRWDLRTSAHEGLWEIPAMKVNYKPLINQTFTVGWSGLAVWAGKSLINTAGSWQQGSGVTLRQPRVSREGWVVQDGCWRCCRTRAQRRAGESGLCHRCRVWCGLQVGSIGSPEVNKRQHLVGEQVVKER